MTRFPTYRELSFFADYIIDVIDVDPEYADQEFAVEFEGRKYFIERHPDHFYCEPVAGESFVLPRF